MLDRLEALRAPFQREPEQTRWLVRIGFAGPIVITLWNVAGTLLIDSLIVNFIGLLVMVAYGTAMAVMVARIMNDSGALRTEAQVDTRRLSRRLNEPHAPEPASGGGVSEAQVARLRDEPTNSFQQTHFMLRLQEEVARARRDGGELSLIWLEVNLPGGAHAPDRTDKMAVEVAHLLAGQAKTIGQSLNLNANEYVFSLPEHSFDAARSFASKLVQALGSYWCNCGIASYPLGGSDADSLFKRARQLCQESAADSDPKRAPGYARSAS